MLYPEQRSGIVAGLVFRVRPIPITWALIPSRNLVVRLGVTCGRVCSSPAQNSRLRRLTICKGRDRALFCRRPHPIVQAGVYGRKGFCGKQAAGVVSRAWQPACLAGHARRRGAVGRQWERSTMQNTVQSTQPKKINRKTALITGITGQDGSYLAELLLDKGYAVHGVVRRSSSFNTDRIEHLYRDPHDPEARLFLHYGDLVDGTGLREILTRVQPDEVYNLGAQSHVRVSFDQPVYTMQADAMGTINLLEAIRDTGKATRYYQATSS